MQGGGTCDCWGTLLWCLCFTLYQLCCCSRYQSVIPSTSSTCQEDGRYQLSLAFWHPEGVSLLIASSFFSQLPCFPYKKRKLKKKKKERELRQHSINLPQGLGWKINPVFWIWGGISLTLGSILPLGSRHFDISRVILEGYCSRWCTAAVCHPLH